MNRREENAVDNEKGTSHISALDGKPYSNVSIWPSAWPTTEEIEQSGADDTAAELRQFEDAANESRDQW